MEVAKKTVSPSVAAIFSTMEYGPAPESDQVVQQWLADHDRKFGHFINNVWVHPDRKTIDSVSPCNGKVLASTLQGNIFCLWPLLLTSKVWNEKKIKNGCFVESD